MVLLIGSTFNHERNPNVKGRWKMLLEQEAFKAVRDVTNGEESTVVYSGVEENLNKYAI
jgi:hypothetical protein